jgi:hypothetical protein
MNQYLVDILTSLVDASPILPHVLKASGESPKSRKAKSQKTPKARRRRREHA